MALKILMIDDDERYLELLKLMFEDDDTCVIISTKCHDLSRLIEVHCPSIVVMDILMEECNGVDLAQQYRTSANSQDIPIILMSAWTGSGELKLPRNSVRIFKPFTHSELLQTIEQVLTDPVSTERQIES